MILAPEERQQRKEQLRELLQNPDAADNQLLIAGLVVSGLAGVPRTPHGIISDYLESWGIEPEEIGTTRDDLQQKSAKWVFARAKDALKRSRRHDFDLEGKSRPGLNDLDVLVKHFGLSLKKLRTNPKKLEKLRRAEALELIRYQCWTSSPQNGWVIFKLIRDYGVKPEELDGVSEEELTTIAACTIYSYLEEWKKVALEQSGSFEDLELFEGFESLERYGLTPERIKILAEAQKVLDAIDDYDSQD